ncbi:hypothetical protein AVEN_207413-1 [Araneus ventricosus]|uniref:Uncharacterized protein n=1 Tax=Araneus ventricosus TaxID=182803 RepID=A0A4Y2JCF9_ARAVE|nr:hypothetical protein AVEN_207413-1 [Araneus ventricosus]
MACLLSWNCRGFRSKFCHIKDLIYEVHPVCIALQDTYLKPAYVTKINIALPEKIMKMNLVELLQRLFSKSPMILLHLSSLYIQICRL